MKPTLKQLLFLTAFTATCTVSQAQTKYKPGNYGRSPVWIQMMNDTTANFNETVKAFRTFFKDRELPEEPDDKNGGDAFEKEVGLGEAEGSEAEREKEERERKHTNEPDYSFEVRAFKGWYYNSKNWLRGDGIIIGPKERQAIIDQQQTELKEIEKRNLKH